MTAAAFDWHTDTGPLPIVDRPRDAAGRFASYRELPPPPAPPVRTVANGAVYVCDDERVNRHRVHVTRDRDGRIHIDYLDESCTR